MAIYAGNMPQKFITARRQSVKYTKAPQAAARNDKIIIIQVYNGCLPFWATSPTPLKFGDFLFSFAGFVRAKNY